MRRRRRVHARRNQGPLGAGRPFYQANRNNDRAELILWESATGREVKRFEGLRGGVHGVAISPDGKWVASASGFYDRGPEGEGRLRVCDAATGAIVLEQTEPFLNALTVAFSPDGRHVAAGFGLYSDHNFPGHFMVFEVATRQLGARPQDQGKRSQRGRLPPGQQAARGRRHGRRRAVGCGQEGETPRPPWPLELGLLGGLQPRRPATGQRRLGSHRPHLGPRDRKALRRIDAHSGIVLGVAFSRDGDAIASCGNEIR